MLLAALLLATPGAVGAATVVLDYDEAKQVDFVTDAYAEEGTTTSVGQGHFEIVNDSGSTTPGDQAFNVDDEQLGLSQVVVQVDGGELFDAVGLEVVNPAESPSELTITAVGGAGSLSAPTTTGPMAFGPGFQNISALVITQNESGAFAFDDLTLEVLPEPGAVTALAAGALALLGLARRRGR